MYTFHKTEKLCSKKVIQSLFQDGNSFTTYPFRVLWVSKVIEQGIAKVVIVVPKKNFKKAVDRNLIKRRIRESYRLNKSSLIEYSIKSNTEISLSLIYLPNEILDYKIINNKMPILINKLILHNEKNSN